MKYLAFVLIICFITFSSCQQSHPFFGTWADNRGNTISFFDDNTFIARIFSGGITRMFEGSWVLLQNTITLNCTALDGVDVQLRIVSEWDIRGNMLRLDWPLDDGVAALTLFKVSN